ncbi:uncharacterized protein LOC132708028 [Cylas formicarius]|uniref:uncharacterized protein LOC132708028 n=1 Tax=Cylas formicarius TaxID=197179 RepID=UPI00295838C9|nr:uncharacterized protein LOC132708028 [Cylas formicarius]
MKSQVAFAFVAFVATVNAGVLVGPSAKILQGPSSKTTVVGPDGSAISAVAPGGQIVHEDHPGVVAHAVPFVAHAAPVAAHAAPVLAHAAPVVAHAAPVVAHAAPVVAHAAAVVAHAGEADTIVAGPSGTIATGKSVVGGHLVHAPVVAYGSDLHEGQYVHDHSESLYDDGSYKPHLYHQGRPRRIKELDQKMGTVRCVHRPENRHTMNSVVIVLFACLAAASAGVVVAPSTKIVQGPSTRTTVVGPDGSSITSSSPGGQIVQEETPAVVARSAPVLAAAAPAVAYSAPAVAYSAPALAYSAPVAAHSVISGYHAPLVSAYSAPIVPAYSTYSAPLVSAYSAPLLSNGVVAQKSLDTVVSGPSGTITTSKTEAVPAVVAAPQVYAAGYYL